MEIVVNQANRLYTQVKPIVTGATISATLLDLSDNTTQNLGSLTEIPNTGLYYIDVNIPDLGEYAVVYSSDVNDNIAGIQAHRLNVVNLEDTLDDRLSVLKQCIEDNALTLQQIDTCTKLIKQGFYNRMIIDENTNELILYDDDSTTELFRFALKDVNGLPTSEKIFEIEKGQ